MNKIEGTPITVADAIKELQTMPQDAYVVVGYHHELLGMWTRYVEFIKISEDGKDFVLCG
jgi:hypothetical protein